MLPLITSCLQVFVVKLHIVSFSSSTQRVAIGFLDKDARTSKIVVWDLKTATRIQIIETQKPSIEAVSFNNSGKMIASYSAEGRVISIWSEGVLGGYKLSKSIPIANKILNGHLDWDGEILNLKEGSSVMHMSVKI